MEVPRRQGILDNHDPAAVAEALVSSMPMYHYKDTTRLAIKKKLGSGSFGDVMLCAITDEEGHEVEVAAKFAKVWPDAFKYGLSDVLSN